MVEKPKGEGDSRRSKGEGEDYRGGHNFKEKKIQRKKRLGSIFPTSNSVNGHIFVQYVVA
jgi:hypothetical protein